MARIHWTSVVGLAVVTAGLAGCGTATIDTAQVERTIAKEFAEQGVTLSGVRCEDVSAEVGAPVRCTAQNPQRTTLFIEGSVTGIEDDRGSFEVEAVRGEARGEAIAAEARRVLEAKVGQRAVAMSCPETVDVPTTDPARCTLTVAGDVRYGVSVTVDEHGKLSTKVDDEPAS